MYDMLCLYCTLPFFHRQNLVWDWDLASQVVLIAWETLWQMSLQEHLGEPIYGKIGKVSLWLVKHDIQVTWTMKNKDVLFVSHQLYQRRPKSLALVHVGPHWLMAWFFGDHEVLVGQCHGWSEGLPPLDMATWRASKGKFRASKTMEWSEVHADSRFSFELPPGYLT